MRFLDLKFLNGTRGNCARNFKSTALVVLLVFGRLSVVLADTNSRTDYHGLFAQRSVTMISTDRTGVMSSASTPLATEEKDSFAASRLAFSQSNPFGRGGTAGATMAWIKLTDPGGKLIYINVEHVTSVRSDTQIPRARAQIDLVSGKFQGVQENVEQVMQLISITSGVREGDTLSAAPVR